MEPYQFAPSDPSYRGQLGEGYRGPFETRVRGGVVASRGGGRVRGGCGVKVAGKGVERGARRRQRAPISIPETPHLELLGGQEYALSVRP